MCVCERARILALVRRLILSVSTRVARADDDGGGAGGSDGGDALSSQNQDYVRMFAIDATS